jgi:hypothetical protein
MIPLWLRRLYVVTVAVYVALGFFFVAQTYAQQERLNGPITTHPVTAKVPTGSDDKTVEAYYQYLDLRHLQQQTQAYQVNPQTLIITYGVLGGTILVVFTLTWMWYSKRRTDSAGLYPVEVYNGYISERNGPVDVYTYANYAAMLAFSAFYIWWNIAFGQWM